MENFLEKAPGDTCDLAPVGEVAAQVAWVRNVSPGAGSALASGVTCPLTGLRPASGLGARDGAWAFTVGVSSVFYQVIKQPGVADGSPDESLVANMKDGAFIEP